MSKLTARPTTTTDPFEAAKQTAAASKAAASPTPPDELPEAPPEALPPEPPAPPVAASTGPLAYRVARAARVSLGAAGTHTLAAGKLLSPEYVTQHGARLREHGVELVPVTA